MFEKGSSASSECVLDKHMAATPPYGHKDVTLISINLLVVYRESVNLIGYITRRLSADSLQLWIANENRSPVYFDQSQSFKF